MWRRIGVGLGGVGLESDYVETGWSRVLLRRVGVGSFGDGLESVEARKYAGLVLSRNGDGFFDFSSAKSEADRASEQMAKRIRERGLLGEDHKKV
ncbi:hypothetical protein LIER_32439 [Lithospermum erythrorhizon]|uniref:Uncharacterized protein n=1 Tax=Lithospermum erythrorhizon TaxID=34254 RepID=A0AAV3RTU4_LITER